MALIKKWIITGDTHRGVRSRIKAIMSQACNATLKPEELGIIILGDVGLNCYLDSSDDRLKYQINNLGPQIYCLRGNHEERPENIPGMKLTLDMETASGVWQEKKYPNIKYLVDGQTYWFGGYKCLALGGAYSVDKYWRLQTRPESWFEEEQLTQEEMNNIYKYVEHESFDFILSHTCPYSFRPTDLFLNFIDQNTVDTSMEQWLEQIKDKIEWGMWCFGHYHADRAERPYVEQFYTSWEDIDDIWIRWRTWRSGAKELPSWLELGPNWNWEET